MQASRRVGEIDLLRFVAALSVVFFHYGFRGHAADGMTTLSYPALVPAAKYGYLGVDLFFMISGFVILMTAHGDNVRHFLHSRITRLFPAFWVCCTLTFVVALLMGAVAYQQPLSTYLLNMTLLGEFLGVPAIDGVYWSLLVEIKFYAAVAALLMLRQMAHAERFLMLWLGLSVALELHPMSHLQHALMTHHATYFVGGAVFFLIGSQGLSRRRLAMLAWSLGLAIVQSEQEALKLEHHYGAHLNPVVVGGLLCAFYAAMLAVSMGWTGMLARTSWRMLGALTYPLYLLHQNIGYMLFNALDGQVSTPLLFWGVLVAMLGAAGAVHVFLERPLSRLLKQALAGQGRVAQA